MRAALLRTLSAAIALALSAAGGAPAHAWEQAALPPIRSGGGPAGLYALVFTLENDALPPINTDRDYTGGLELDARFLGEAPRREGAPRRPFYGFVLGQAIYTPRDLGATRIVLNDRPYAAWAYLGFYWGGQGARGAYNKHRIELGTIGPQAGGRSVQKSLHDQLAQSPDPRGWSFQIGHEVGVQYAYEAVPVRAILAHRGTGDAPFVDGAAFYRLRAGNIFTSGTAGYALRMGDLSDDSPGAADVPAAGNGTVGRGAMVFATAALTAVLYDATIEGGWVHERVLKRHNSPHVEEVRPLRADLSVGFVYRWRHHTLLYALNSLSTELRARRATLFDHGYGTLLWMWHFQ